MAIADFFVHAVGKSLTRGIQSHAETVYKLLGDMVALREGRKMAGDELETAVRVMLNQAGKDGENHVFGVAAGASDLFFRQAVTAEGKLGRPEFMSGEEFTRFLKERSLSDFDRSSLRALGEVLPEDVQALANQAASTAAVAPASSATASLGTTGAPIAAPARLGPGPGFPAPGSDTGVDAVNRLTADINASLKPKGPVPNGGPIIATTPPYASLDGAISMPGLRVELSAPRFPASADPAPFVLQEPASKSVLARTGSAAEFPTASKTIAEVPPAGRTTAIEADAALATEASAAAQPGFLARARAGLQNSGSSLTNRVRSMVARRLPIAQNVAEEVPAEVVTASSTATGTAVKAETSYTEAVVADANAFNKNLRDAAVRAETERAARVAPVEATEVVARDVAAEARVTPALTPAQLRTQELANLAGDHTSAIGQAQLRRETATEVAAEATATVESVPTGAFRAGLTRARSTARDFGSNARRHVDGAVETVRNNPRVATALAATAATVVGGVGIYKARHSDSERPQEVAALPTETHRLLQEPSLPVEIRRRITEQDDKPGSGYKAFLANHVRGHKDTPASKKQFDADVRLATTLLQKGNLTIGEKGLTESQMYAAATLGPQRFAYLEAMYQKDVTGNVADVAQQLKGGAGRQALGELPDALAAMAKAGGGQHMKNGKPNWEHIGKVAGNTQFIGKISKDLEGDPTPAKLLANAAVYTKSPEAKATADASTRPARREQQQASVTPSP